MNNQTSTAKQADRAITHLRLFRYISHLIYRETLLISHMDAVSTEVIALPESLLHEQYMIALSHTSHIRPLGSGNSSSPIAVAIRSQTRWAGVITAK